MYFKAHVHVHIKHSIHARLYVLFFIRLDDFTNTLSDEICLDFTRSMNKIMFDETVTGNPSMFPFVTLPEPEEKPVPQTGQRVFT